MQTGDKVLVITGMEASSTIIKEGTAGAVEENFVWINGAPYARMFVILDTAYNRSVFASHVECMKDWELSKPNAYEILNRMDK